jgi:hypothetical protein
MTLWIAAIHCMIGIIMPHDSHTTTSDIGLLRLSRTYPGSADDDIVRQHDIVGRRWR